MRVLINNMTMPSACYECWALDESGVRPVCRITGEMRGYNFRVREKRMKECPLVELSNHGNLIDREVLAKELGINNFDCKKCGWYKETPSPIIGHYCGADVDLDDVCFALENAEVIIPAERSEE